jgi:hypothetical protein
MLAALISNISPEILGARVFTTALVVVAVSWAVGAFGPLIGGTLAGLPIILGPGFYFLATQAPAPFVSQAASYALLSLCATQFFLLAYIATAWRGIPLASLGCAIATWLLAALILQFLPAHPVMGMALFVLTTGACLRLSIRFISPVPAMTDKPGWGLLITRGLLAGALVAAVTTLSYWLGSSGSGLLLAFPIGYTMVAVTVHQKYGTASAVATLRSALLGTVGVAGFCTALALAIPHGSAITAFAIALATSALITFGLVFAQRIRTIAKTRRSAPR